MPKQHPKVWVFLDYTRHTKDICQELGVSPTAVYLNRLKYAPDTIGKHLYNFDSVNWNQNNQRISEQTGIPHTRISANRTKYAPETLGKYRASPRKKTKIKVEN